MTTQRSADRKNGRKTDGTFAAGHVGRSKGSLNRSTQAALALLEGEAEALACNATLHLRTAIASDAVLH